MYTKIVWEVRLPAPPPVIRHCKKCGTKTEFFSSGQFRVNAQKKHLDIWLIYQCAHCGTTWNATIYSRCRPDSLPPGLLQKFHENDPALAAEIAMQPQFLRQNGGEPGACHFTISGEPLPAGEAVELHIRNPQAVPLRLTAVLRQALALSQSALKKMLLEGRIHGVPGQNVERCKVAEETIVYLEGLPLSADGNPPGFALN